MLTESGRVVAVEDDGVWVETIRSSTCGRCAARSGCGQGALSRWGLGKGLIRAAQTERVSASSCGIGDEVDIELPEKALLWGVFWVYVLPLMLGLVLTALLTSRGEGASILGFLSGLALGFLLARWLPDNLGAAEFFEPRLSAIRKGQQALPVNIIG